MYLRNVRRDIVGGYIYVTDTFLQTYHSKYETHFLDHRISKLHHYLESSEARHRSHSSFIEL